MIPMSVNFDWIRSRAIAEPPLDRFPGDTYLVFKGEFPYPYYYSGVSLPPPSNPWTSMLALISHTEIQEKGWHWTIDILWRKRLFQGVAFWYEDRPIVFKYKPTDCECSTCSGGRVKVAEGWVPMVNEHGISRGKKDHASSEW